MTCRDESFYLDVITIQIEDTLFKVPKAIFARSEVFVGMFDLPHRGTSPEGSSDECPFVIQGVKAADFRVFVRAMLAQLIGLTAALVATEWIAVLYLADRWIMNDLRQHAISASTPLFTSADAVDQLVVGQQLHIDGWVLAAVEELVVRRESLSPTEIMMLGPQTVARVLRVRDRHMMTLMLEKYLPTPTGSLARGGGISKCAREAFEIA